jgi:hypothetical protein
LGGRLGLALVGLLGLGGCDGGSGDPASSSSADYRGRTAIRWTLNGAPLTAQSCQSLQLTSMQVAVASLTDSSQLAEFVSVSCGLDRYSIEMVPSGPVRIFVDGMNRGSSGSCIRYSGQIDTAIGTQFPTTPVDVALHAVANCP